MVNKCCICKYRVGNVENNSRFTLFKAPRDEELYKKWEAVFISVGWLLKKSSFVCENHFLKNDIIKERVIKDVSGNVLFQRSLRRRRLALNAIPVFFNTSIKNVQNNEGKYYTDNSATNPQPPSAVIQDLLSVPSSNGQSSTLISENYSKSLELNDIVNDVKTESISATCNDTCTTSIIERKCLLRVPSSNGQSSTLISENYSKSIELNDIVNDVKTESISASSNDTCTTSIIERKCLDVFSTSHCLKLPNTLWAVHKVDLPKKMLIVNKVRPSLTEEPNVSLIEKQVVLQENGNCQIFIFNKLVKVYDTYPNTCEEVELFIRKIDSLKICTGGPSIYEYRHVHCTCAYQDPITNKWRHNLCEWALEIGTICKQCLKLDSTLRRHFDTAVKKKNSSTTQLSLLTNTYSQTLKRYKIRSKKIGAKIRNAEKVIKKANKEEAEKI